MWMSTSAASAWRELSAVGQFRDGIGSHPVPAWSLSLTSTQHHRSDRPVPITRAGEGTSAAACDALSNRFTRTCSSACGTRRPAIGLPHRGKPSGWIGLDRIHQPARHEGWVVIPGLPFLYEDSRDAKQPGEDRLAHK
jgi:hypothetical protein